MRDPETGAGTLPGGNTKERAGGHLHLDFCLYFHYIEQPVLTAISGPGGHARQCSSSPQSHGSGRKQLGHPGPDSQDLLTQTSQTGTILKSRGGAREGPGRPSQAPGRMPAVPPGPSPLLPRGPEAPTPRPWPDSQRCATCQVLGLLPAKPAAQGLRLRCHQSSSSVSWTRPKAPEEAAVWGEESAPAGRGGCSHSGRGPRPLGREHTPISRGPQRHASPCSQTAGRQICTSICKVLEFSPGCHTAYGA